MAAAGTATTDTKGRLITSARVLVLMLIMSPLVVRGVRVGEENARKGGGHEMGLEVGHN